MRFRPRQPPKVDLDTDGLPDLRQFTASAAEYRQQHAEAVRAGDGSARGIAQWGLAAQGVDALPFLQEMLRSSSPEAREDAAGALAWIGTRQPEVITALIETLATSSEREERDTIVQSLGELKSRAALPVLGEIVRDETSDPDARHTAALAVGKIVRRRFDRSPDVVAAAVGWLDKHPL